MENEHRENQRERNRQGSQHWRTEVSHEQEYHYAGKDYAQDNVGCQVADGVFEQLGLVARHCEFHSGIILPELPEEVVHGFAERRHPRIALLDDRDRDGLFAVAAYKPGPFGRTEHDIGHIPDLENLVSAVKIYVRDIVPA